MSNSWKYYNHAAIPTCGPHQTPNLQPIEDNSIWKLKEGFVLLARWTSDFDCGYDTGWWYIIKDSALELEQCKKKVRKELRKALDSLDVRIINPEEYENDIKYVYKAAVSNYTIPDGALELKNVEKKEDEEWVGAFIKNTDELIAYKVAKLHDDYVEMVTSKANPNYLKLSPFLALNYYQIKIYINSGKYRYMTNGTRTILHQSKYNDYLEHKLGFRKAYCKLHLKYRFPYGAIIQLLWLFRNLLKKMDSIRIIHKVNGILAMHDIFIKQKRKAICDKAAKQ